MAENGKQTNRGGLFGPPRNGEQQDPGSPNQQESVDFLEGSLARLKAVIENVERDIRLTSVLRAAPMGIGLVVNRVLLEVNDWFCDMVGYRRDELIGRNSRMLYPTQEEWEYVGRENYGQIDVRSKGMLETRFRRKDGEVIDVLLSSTLLDLGDPSRGVTFTALNITARKKAENELRDIFSLSLDMICVADLRTDTFTKVNPAFEKILGYSEQELLSQPFMEFVHPDDLTCAQEILEEKLHQGKRVVHFENRFRCKDGSYRWLDWTAHPQPEQGLIYGIARDITERKRATEMLQRQGQQLRESERKLRTLMGNLPGIAYRCANEPDWPFEFVSEGSLALTGYEPREITLGGIVAYGELIHPDDQQRVWDTVQEAGSHGVPFEMEYRIRTKEGAEKWVFERGRAVPSDTGGPPFLEGFITDITQRKYAEMALQEKEYLLSESQRMGRIGSWSVDLATGVLTWTCETYRLYGVSPDTFVPSPEGLLDLLPLDDRARMREWIRSALANEQPGAMEFRTVLPDGSTRILSGRGEMVFGEDGRPVRLVGTVQDITEEKEAELALRELGRKDEEALRVARMGHWEFDVATGTFLFNDQYYTLHGMTAREAGGYRMTAEEFARRYVHPEDAPLIFENVRKAVATDDPNFQLQGEARILRSDGEMRWVNVWFRVEKDAAGRTIRLHGVNQDITERRAAEEALRRLNEHLETLVAERTEDLTRTVTRLRQLTWELSQTEDRERKRIADILHDDVQQILAAARFHLNLLSIGPRSPEESCELLGQIKQMLKEAIEKARSLSHELSPVLYQVDLTETLRWLARHMHEKHGLTIQVEARDPVELSSECVKALLYKVSQELLFNVIKHSGVKEAVIRVRRMGRYICLTVTDRGCGFKPPELEKTAGFGLLGIRERIQLLGGRMKIKSKPGMGCRLLIAIPDEGPTPATTQAG